MCDFGVGFDGGGLVDVVLYFGIIGVVEDVYQEIGVKFGQFIGKWVKFIVYDLVL